MAPKLCILSLTLSSCGLSAAWGMPHALPEPREDADSIPATSRHLPSKLTAVEEMPLKSLDILVKTDIIPWAAGIMNINPEICFNRRFSLSLPIWYCPWFIARKHALRVAAFQPEGRWWPDEAGKGHFAGIHLSVAWYNLKWGKYRYQDCRRPLLGAGLTYGYTFRFDDHWGLELSAGVGFFNTRYDRFFNVDNGQLADTRQTTFFGPDHLSVSLIYNINP